MLPSDAAMRSGGALYCSASAAASSVSVRGTSSAAHTSAATGSSPTYRSLSGPSSTSSASLSCAASTSVLRLNWGSCWGIGLSGVGGQNRSGVSTQAATRSSAASAMAKLRGRFRVKNGTEARIPAARLR